MISPMGHGVILFIAADACRDISPGIHSRQDDRTTTGGLAGGLHSLGM